MVNMAYRAYVDMRLGSLKLCLRHVTVLPFEKYIGHLIGMYALEF